MTASHSEVENVVVVQCTRLGSPSLTRETSVVPRELLVFGLHWNPEELASNITEGMLWRQRQQDRWTCQQDWRQGAGSKIFFLCILSSGLFPEAADVWGVVFPAPNNLTKKIPHRRAQQLCSSWSQVQSSWQSKLTILGHWEGLKIFLKREQYWEIRWEPLCPYRDVLFSPKPHWLSPRAECLMLEVPMMLSKRPFCHSVGQKEPVWGEYHPHKVVKGPQIHRFSWLDNENPVYERAKGRPHQSL